MNVFESELKRPQQFLKSIFVFLAMRILMFVNASRNSKRHLLSTYLIATFTSISSAIGKNFVLPLLKERRSGEPIQGELKYDMVVLLN